MSEELEGALRTYAPLPPAGWYAETIRTTEDAYTADQMRAFADATCALRALRAARAGAQAVPSDAEIDALASLHTRSVETPTRYVTRNRDFARAVLARWGAAAPSESPSGPILAWMDDGTHVRDGSAGMMTRVITAATKATMHATTAAAYTVPLVAASQVQEASTTSRQDAKE